MKCFCVSSENQECSFESIHLKSLNFSFLQLFLTPASCMAMEVENQATSPAFDDFLQTGRTGRRNALPDIHSENATISTAALPESLQKLTCSDIPMDAGCSGQASGSGQGVERESSNT